MALGISDQEVGYTNATFSEKKYRVANGRVISYRTLDFSKVKRSIIKEVWIGPKSKVSQMDVRDILAKYDYYDKSKGYSIDEPIPIHTSESSYR